MTQLYCPPCRRFADLAEWTRIIFRTPVVSGRRIVGYVATYRHMPCRVCASVPVS